MRPARVGIAAAATLAALLGAPCLGAPLAAQDSTSVGKQVETALAASSATAFAEIYAVLMARGEFEAAARLTHPEALRPIRRMVMLISRSEPAMRKQMLGVESEAEANALGDEAIFAKFLTMSFATQAGLREVMASAKIQIVGTVAEGNEVMHAVNRVTMGIEGMTITQMTVLSMRRHGDGWRALLTADLENMVARLEAMAP